MKHHRTPIARLVIQLALAAVLMKGIACDDDNQGVQTLPCNQHLMNSYLLKGREYSKDQKLLMCPTVKNNCCVHQDQQRIFHYVKDLVRTRINEYSTKTDILLQRILNMHQQVTVKPPVFKGIRKRRRFCSKKLRDVLNFKLQDLYNDLHSEIIDGVTEFESHYSRFFCMLCDGKAHQYISIKDHGKYVSFNAEYCREVLTENQKLIEDMNVELMKYMEDLQHTVDCLHYSKAYNLRFPRRDKVRLKKTVVSCMQNLHGPEFLNKCTRLCNRIRYSQLTPLIHGEFAFLHEMTTIFNRFMKYRESGNVISMKLRRFFRQFRINPRLARTKRYDFSKRLVKRPVKTDSKKERKLADQSKAGADNPLHNPPGANKGRKTVKLSGGLQAEVGRDRRRERVLFDGERGWRSGSQSEDFTAGIANRPPSKAQVAIDRSSGSMDSVDSVRRFALMGLQRRGGRVLEGEPSLANKRFLESQIRKRRAKKGSDARYPDPYYDRQLREFYKDLKVAVNDTRKTIFVVKARPINFDKLKRNWMMDSGINLMDYANSDFHMPSRIFYNLLYKFRKPEMPDTRLTLFLMDFNKNFYKNALGSLEFESEILVPNFGTFHGEVDLGGIYGRRRKLVERQGSVGNKRLK